MRVVEAQAVRTHIRARLPDVRTEDRAQGGVQQVRCRVVALRAQAPFAIDEGMGRLVPADRTLEDGAEVHDGFAKAVRVVDAKAAGGRGDLPAIAHLATALGIERCGGEHKLAMLASLEMVDASALDEHCGYHRF